MATTLSGLMSQWQTAQEGARLSNLRRGEQITAIYDEIIKRYEPGGAFEKAGLAEIGKAKTKGVGQEMQQMISSGLYGTTTAAGVPRRWESEVGAPSRLKLEDIMMQRLSAAQTGKAGFMERIEEPYPDYGALMSAMSQPGAAGGGGGAVGGGGGGYTPQYMKAFTESRAQGERMARATGSWGYPSPTSGAAAPTAAPVTTPTAAKQVARPTGVTGAGDQDANGTWVNVLTNERKPGRGTDKMGWIWQFEPFRQIPKQRTPAAMEQYLKTYTPRTGDYTVR